MCAAPALAVNNLILLVICFVIGIALRRSGRLPEQAPATLNSFIIYVSLPALALLHVHDLTLSGDMALVAGMAWLHLTLAVAFFWAVGKWLKLPRATVGALILMGGLGNTSFLGLPMIEAYYGKEAIVTGIVADQLGSFLALSTAGIMVAGLYSSETPAATNILRRVALFPPFLALLLGVALMPVAYPDWLVAVLKRLGDTLAPLALVAVGFQLRLEQLAANRRNLAIGLLFKLVLAPLAIFLLYVPLLGAGGQTIQVTLFEAAMPPMITASILATEHDLDPPLATSMVAVGVMLSFATLAGWWWVLARIVPA